MSFIFIQVGQCGNQVGHEFWTLLRSEKEKRKPKMPCYSLFHPNGHARCVFVDSEPKVLQSIIDDKSSHQYINLKNVRYSYPGCGNNWGLGFHLQTTCECPVMQCNEYLLEETVHAFRLEVEKCDYVKGAFIIHSLGGGTGSGFGCRVIQEIRNRYPAMYILSICVAPYRHGDTPLQHYNTLLSMAHIQKYTDGVILFQNDDILRSLNRDFETSSTNRRLNKNNYSLSDVNKYIASNLVNMFLPMQDEQNKWKQFDLFTVMNTLCSDSKTKFIEIHTSALLTHNHQAKTSWQYISEDLVKQMPIYDSVLNQPISSLHTQVIIRGGLQSKYDSQTIRRVLAQKACKPVPWLSQTDVTYSRDRVYQQEQRAENMDFVISNTKPAMCSQVKPIELTLTIITNRSHIIEFLNHILVKSSSMIDSNAYIHWYERHGCDRNKFEECFDTLKQIIHNYVKHLR
jgi:hypothetical protein